jgi:hypothetical protein
MAKVKAKKEALAAAGDTAKPAAAQGSAAETQVATIYLASGNILLNRRRSHTRAQMPV